MLARFRMLSLAYVVAFAKLFSLACLGVTPKLLQSQLGCVDMRNCFSTTGYGSQECSNPMSSWHVTNESVTSCCLSYVVCTFICMPASLDKIRVQRKCLQGSITNLTATWRQSIHTKTSERPGNRGSVLSFFQQPLLYSMHGTASFSTDSFVGLQNSCVHCYCELQKIIVLPQRQLNSIL